MPNKVHSFLSWRPRISIRMKKFPGRGPDADASDEDDDEEGMGRQGGSPKRFGSSVHRNVVLENDYIVDVSPAPPKLQTPAHRSPFQTEPQLFTHPATASTNFNSATKTTMNKNEELTKKFDSRQHHMSRGGGAAESPVVATSNNGTSTEHQRKRAVRFSEEFIPSPPKPPPQQTAMILPNGGATTIPPAVHSYEQSQRVQFNRSPVNTSNRQSRKNPTPFPQVQQQHHPRQQQQADESSSPHHPPPPPLSPYYNNPNNLLSSSTLDSPQSQTTFGSPLPTKWSPKQQQQPKRLMMTSIPESPPPPTTTTTYKLPPSRDYASVSGGGIEGGGRMTPAVGGGGEYTHPPRPLRNKPNRANFLLQQLRATDEPESDTNESVVSAVNVSHHAKPAVVGGQKQGMMSGGGGQRVGGLPLASKGQVYLEYNNETKRSMLPVYLRSVEQIKSLFLRSFPNLSIGYLNQPNVRIYIQQEAAGARRPIFYELEDILDVKDQSVLKIHEQSSSSVYTALNQQIPLRYPKSPPPPVGYFSEPEFELNRTQWNLAEYDRPQPMRPSSVQTVPHSGYYGAARHRQPGLPPSYGQPEQYSSDSSSQYARSGSSTPIIDRETRAKIDTMGQQLDKLSSLVHSALLPNNPLSSKEAQRREMLELRRQIMELREFPQLNSTGLTDSSTTTVSNNSSSFSSSCFANPNEEGVYDKVQNQIMAIRSDLNSLKQHAQNPMQSQEDDNIEIAPVQKAQKLFRQDSTTENHLNVETETQQQDDTETLKQNFLDRLKALQVSLKSFEENVEDIRESVLNSNRKLRMAEVEALTNALTEIGKTAASLKMEVPDLQTELEGTVQRYMESIAQEENFIREKLPQVDGCLHRCKALANMMVTMKKLAMVQDQWCNKQGGDQGSCTPKLHGGIISDELNNGNLDDDPQHDNKATNAHHINGVHISNIGGQVVNGGIGSNKKIRSNISTRPAPAAWAHQWPHSAHALDSILNELNDLNNNVPKRSGRGM